MFAIRYLRSLFANSNQDRRGSIEEITGAEVSSPQHFPTPTHAPENVPPSDPKRTEPVRIKRENGFGDFCFDSVSMRNEKFEREKKRKGKKGSLDSTIVESSRAKGGVLRQQVMEDLIRLGSFPFMKLPIEIRERIYRWVAMPYNYDSEQQFDIRIQRFYAVNQFTSQFYSNGFEDHFAPMDINLADLETRDEQVALYEFKKARFHQKHAVHPRRHFNYLFSTNLKGKYGFENKRRKPAEEDKWAIEWKREISVEMIRNLSNVNTQVRNELGTVLWRNVHIGCDDYCHDALVIFLMERPAIHAGIKSLKFSIMLESMNSQSLIHDKIKFNNFCLYISRTLVLDHLDVFLHFNLSDADDITKCEGDFGFLEALREIEVRRKFHLGAMLYFGSGEEEHKHMKRVVKPIMRKMRRGLRPYSLLDKDPTTEEDEYLQERKELVHRFRKHERRISRVQRGSVA